MDPRKFDNIFKFAEASLTPRKHEILTWLPANHVELRSLDMNDLSSMEAFRVYIPLRLSPLGLSWTPKPTVLDLERMVSDLVVELFDDRLTLEYVDSYPDNTDKYRLVPIET